MACNKPGTKMSLDGQNLIGTHTTGGGHVHLLHAPDSILQCHTTSSNIIHTAMMHAEATQMSHADPGGVESRVAHGRITDGEQEVIQIPVIPTLNEEQMVLHTAPQVDNTVQIEHDSSPTSRVSQRKAESHQNSLDMMDFMDVITSYKCKFCSYSSPVPQDIGNHVQNIHMTLEGEDRQISTMDRRTQIAESANNHCSESEEQEGKELYLCGQCSLDFNNIDDCKNHMIKEHNVNAAALEEHHQEVSPLENVSYTSNKVSVGTQVVKKKVGRKRKVPVKEDSAGKEDIQDKEDSLSDIEAYETSGKRRVCPPRSLTQLYVLAKRKPPSLRLNTRDYTLTCPKSTCMARFKTAESLELHKSCHVTLVNVPKKGKPYVCPTCSTEFCQWKILRMHLWKEHNQDTDLFSCDQCNFKTDTGYRLEAHLEIHEDSKGYLCNVCGKSFKQKRQMLNHKVLHCDRSAEGDKWYSNRKCEICKRVFANSKSLKSHVTAVHGKEKPFQCPYCNHATARKAMMELHIRTHTGEKPFKCDLCPYATGDHNSFRRHKMRHSGAKPYHCPHCPYSCIQSVSLKTHMKNKHPGCEGIYSCESCQYRTVNKTYWENHLEDHRNGLITVNPSTSSADSSKPQKVEGGASMNLPQQIQIQSSTGAPISTIDLSRMPAHSQTDAAQIIYTALSAIQHREGEVMTTPAGGQQLHPVVDSVTEDGVTTHTITFHIGPDNAATQQILGQDVGEVIVALEPEGLEQQLCIVQKNDSLVVMSSEADDNSKQIILTPSSTEATGRVQSIPLTDAKDTEEIVVTNIDNDRQQMQYNENKALTNTRTS